MNADHHSDYGPELLPGKPVGLPAKRDWSNNTFCGVSWSPETYRDPPAGKRLSAQSERVWAARFEERVRLGFAEVLTRLLRQPMRVSRGDAGRFYHAPPGACFANYRRRCGRWGWGGHVVVEFWPIADSEFASCAAQAVRDMIEDREGERRVCARNGWRLGPFGFTIVALPRSWAWAGGSNSALATSVGSLPVIIGMWQSFPALAALAASTALSTSSGDAGIAAPRRGRARTIH